MAQKLVTNPQLDGIAGSKVTGAVPLATTVTTNANLTGDVTSVGNATTLNTVTVNKGGTGATTLTGVLKGSGTAAISPATAGTDFSAGTSALATGILKSTTSTGALSIAVAADFPTLNQNTTGTSSNVTGIVAPLHGGTGETTLANALTALLPVQTGNAGKFLQTNATVPSWVAVTGTAAGASTQIQYNLGGSFAANPGLTFTLATTNVFRFFNFSIESTGFTTSLALLKGDNDATNAAGIQVRGGTNTTSNLAGGHMSVGGGGSTTAGGVTLQAAGVTGAGATAGSVTIASGTSSGGGNVGNGITLQTNGNDRLNITSAGAFSIGGSAGSAGQVLTSQGAAAVPTWTTISSSGTVQSVSVVTANGVSGTVANPTTVPAITLALGAITPGSVASVGTVTGSNLSGTNTGDRPPGGSTNQVQLNAGSGNFGASAGLTFSSGSNTLSIGADTGSGVARIGDVNLTGTTALVIDHPISATNLSGTNTGDQTLNSLLPSQTGSSGKVLGTDGSVSSWVAVDGGVPGWNLLVRAATTTNITTTGNVVLDGITTAPGDRILVKNQSTPSQNGIYVAAAGAWALASDNPTGVGAAVPVAFGLAGSGTVWQKSSATGWTQLGDQILLTTAGSTGLTLTASAMTGAFATRFNGRGNQTETLTLAGTLAVASGGTGLTAAGTSGNVLTSNGTDWVSSAPSGGGPTNLVLPATQTSTGAYVSLTNLVFTGTANSLYTCTYIGTFQGDSQNDAPFLAFTVPGTSTVVGQMYYGANSGSPSGIGSLTEQRVSGSAENATATIRAGSITLPITGTWVIKMDATGGSCQLKLSVRTGTARLQADGVLSVTKVA